MALFTAGVILIVTTSFQVGGVLFGMAVLFFFLTIVACRKAQMLQSRNLMRPQIIEQPVNIPPNVNTQFAAMPQPHPPDNTPPYPPVAPQECPPYQHISNVSQTANPASFAPTSGLPPYPQHMVVHMPQNDQNTNDPPPPSYDDVITGKASNM